MIDFNNKEKINKDIEIFKISKKSLCQSCSFINRVCCNNVSMTCGTDSKEGKAFVVTCNKYKDKSK